ncbi:MAG: DUF6036 family nucleotidyltransferase [Thermodesulfobacteriota bacterium]
MNGFSKKDILKLFDLLNEELSQKKIKGELYLVGGAVMSLVFNERVSTKDLDGVFRPTQEIRKAVKKIAKDHGFDEDWLNDAVKGFLSKDQEYDQYLELSNLKVYCATPEYLLAMKCLSMRIGEEFEDENDIIYLLRYLNISDYKKAVDLITKFYPKEKIPQKTFYALEEILG